MSLRNLFRRQAETPTLRDRAADLRASLAAPRPQQNPTPETDSTPAAAQESVATADPIFGIIEDHVAAQAAFSAVCPRIDKAARRQQGLDTSDEAMAPAQAAWDAANENEVKAWNALFEARPTTLAGVLAVIRHAQKWAPENDGVKGALPLRDIFEAIADGLAGGMKAEAASSTLVRKITEEWAAWGLVVNEVDDSTESTATWEQADVKRDRLLHAAMALPATPENIAAKALACAWMEWVCVERPGQPRDAYGPADQLVYDIHATIMGRGTKAGGDGRKVGSLAPADLADACDQAIYDWNAIQPRSRTENWDDDRLDEALDAYGAVFGRAIREPSRTLSETQAKARLLLHDLREHQGNDEGQETDDQRLMRVVLREVAALTGEDKTLSGTMMGPDLVGLIDLSSATIEELRAVSETADELGTAAHAQAWMGRSKVRGSDWDLNPAGQLAQRIGDALIEVVSAAISEARGRAPADDDDRRIRFEILARSIMQNGDPAETTAFARELLASVEQ